VWGVFSFPNLVEIYPDRFTCKYKYIYKGVCKVMFLAGIDYSMSSPGICVFDTNKELSFLNCNFYVYTKTPTNLNFDNIEMEKQPKKFNNNQERFDSISNWALRILKSHNIERCAIEGFSYGSVSNRLFEIGENTGLLKYKLWLNKIEFDIYSPGEIKKYYSGKGNSNKEKMHMTLTEKENISLGSNNDSPVSDIIDSYAILSLLVSQHSGLI
jgi:Holliday junction resolvasome RuvABC endonuclease subunit